MNKNGYIYAIINKTNGKYYYGKTFSIHQRWQAHLLNASKKINRRLYDAMNYYGYENFSIHKIKEIFGSQEDISAQLNNLERYFINLSSSNNPLYGYNMTIGGDGGDTLKNHINRDLIIQKRNNSNKGKKRSEEFCKRIQKIAKNVSSDIRKKAGEKGGQTKRKRYKKTGYTKSEIEAHLKNSQFLSEYNKSIEARNRVSEQWKGKKKPPFSEEHKKNIGKASKGRKIPGRKILIENKEYESLHEASRILNIPLMTIRNRLINPKFPNWVYLDK